MKNGFFQVVSNRDAETFNWGKRLADFLKSGDVIALYGELGSGKTVFAQGVCAGLEVHDDVTSPTFTLIQEYRGRMPVFHFDFYRLTSEREVEDLDVFEYWTSEGISLVEWADRGESLLPEKRISVILDRFRENEKISIEKRLISIGGCVRKKLMACYRDCSGH
ncbi:tRNA (adenosine(37)-N6)-threonylcarbamoyltransferase complex ATPase subunit type 1 TsaE [bacterium]|nr:tRNA (adenosine(37)-N6)-threonylcarbamoyltransferase complex ATPase subunit type 1 TsaE [bacterium]RQV93665.1 MAG: tRNA (adenosine(37)-N6)-threonylcarbamoyltransferase complex ATPase subunit type 1 TsaE [bacterium]